MDANSLGTKLSSTLIEGGPQRIVFLHGLMGRGRNFQMHAKGIQEQATSLLVDLPNHGASAWTDEFDYVLFADALAAHLEADFAKDEPVVVLGHSMGGKIAMILALRHSHLIKSLIVEDMSPVHTGNSSEFVHLLGSMLGIDLSTVKARKDADDALAENVDGTMLRGFLLQNLRRGEDGFYWEPNLQMLYDSLDIIADFPDTDAHYDEQVLWIKGEKSPYITEEKVPAMHRFFPKARKVTIRDAGHWIHTEQPERFRAVISAYLNRVYRH